MPFCFSFPTKHTFYTNTFTTATIHFSLVLFHQLCLFLGSIGTIILIILHTFIVNPLRAVAIVCSRIPGYFLIEYHRGLLVRSSTAESGNYLRETRNREQDTQVAPGSRRRVPPVPVRRRGQRIANTNDPEREELFRFLNFHRQQQNILLGRSSALGGTSLERSNISTTSRVPFEDSIRNPDPAVLNIDPSARLSVVLNYRRPRDQVDDPLHYFNPRPPGSPPSHNSNTTDEPSHSSNMNNPAEINRMTRKVFGETEWQYVIDDMGVTFQDLNSIIMNYLVVEGYHSAAEKFVREAGIKISADGLGFANDMMPPYAGSNVVEEDRGKKITGKEENTNDEDVFSSIKDRMAIKTLIHSGQIQSAVEKINDVDPELLDQQPELHFALLRLHLIELIRACNYPATLSNRCIHNNSTTPGAPDDIIPALEFATTHLARRAPGNPKFLADLEQTMALLCFPPGNNVPPQLQKLMDVKMRQDVAREVNSVILKRLGIEGDSKMVNLVKLWAWGERELDSEKVVFPRLEKSSLV